MPNHRAARLGRDFAYQTEPPGAGRGGWLRGIWCRDHARGLGRSPPAARWKTASRNAERSATRPTCACDGLRAAQRVAPDQWFADATCGTIREAVEDRSGVRLQGHGLGLSLQTEFAPTNAPPAICPIHGQQGRFKRRRRATFPPRAATPGDVKTRLNPGPDTKCCLRSSDLTAKMGLRNPG